jgi:hypothetical protein
MQFKFEFGFDFGQVADWLGDHDGMTTIKGRSL